MASSRSKGPRLDDLIERTRDPVFLVGPDGGLAGVNSAWQDLTGHSESEVIGLPCRPHGPTRPGAPDGISGSFCPPLEAFERPGPTFANTLIIHRGGDRLWRRIEFRPLRDAAGALLGILGFVRETEPDEFEAERTIREELLALRFRAHEHYGVDGYVGSGPRFRKTLDQMKLSAQSRVPTMILGEAGTGKHHVARLIHQSGSRNQATLVTLDCRVLPAEVLERELFVDFGRSDSVGRKSYFKFPEGTTLVLGDAAELPRDVQARLASAISDRVHFIAVSSVDPEGAAGSDRFRGDFLQAATTLVIRLDPLRNRREELPILAQHFLERNNLRGERSRHGFSKEALDLLLAYDWPGNIREFARVVEAAHGTSDAPTVSATDVPREILGERGGAFAPPHRESPDRSLDDMLLEVERRLIELALERARGNKSKAAEILGISRPRLYRRIKELGMPEDSDEPSPRSDS